MRCEISETGKFLQIRKLLQKPPLYYGVKIPQGEVMIFKGSVDRVLEHSLTDKVMEGLRIRIAQLGLTLSDLSFSSTDAGLWVTEFGFGIEKESPIPSRDKAVAWIRENVLPMLTDAITSVNGETST